MGTSISGRSVAAPSSRPEQRGWCHKITNVLAPLPKKEPQEAEEQRIGQLCEDLTQDLAATPRLNPTMDGFVIRITLG